MILDFLKKPFVLHLLIVLATIGIVIANGRFGLGLTADEIHAVIVGGVALLLGTSLGNAANIVGDAHYDAHMDSTQALIDASAKSLIDAQLNRAAESEKQGGPT